MSLKSKKAFEFTLQDMNSEVYFWTFTFREPHSVVECSKAWSLFWSGWKGLYQAFPTVSGLRVFEEHPGKTIGACPDDYSHGWHIHCIFNQRLPVDIVRTIGRRYGIGRMQVERIPPSGAI